MQNKPNVKDAKMNVSAYFARRYAQVRHLVIEKNKANSNPIKAKTKPKQTQLPKGQN